MENCFFATFQRFKSTLDQLFTCLTQNLQGHIFGNVIFFYQTTHKIKFRIAGRRETNFNLLKSNLYKKIKKFKFLLNTHRINKRLITITKIYRTPKRCLCNLVIRPGTILQRNILKWTILTFRIHRNFHFYLP